MADVDDLQATEATRVMGSDAAGNETNPVDSSPNRELWIRDTHDNGGLDAVLTLVAGVPQELKVGILPKSLRKYAIFEAQGTNIKWGFSNSTQSFDVFKSQLLMVPIGENTEIWFLLDKPSGTGLVAIGEIS